MRKLRSSLHYSEFLNELLLGFQDYRQSCHFKYMNIAHKAQETANTLSSRLRGEFKPALHKKSLGQFRQNLLCTAKVIYNEHDNHR